MANSPIIYGPNGALNLEAALTLTATNAALFTISANAATSSYSVILPASQAAGALTNDGAGNLSWTAAGGVTTLSAVGASPNANAGVISGSTLNLEPFSSSFPGVVTASGGGTSNFLRADGTWTAPAAITALTGDGTATGPGSVPLTLATVNSNVGSFTNANITVNAKGLITAASSGTAVTNKAPTVQRFTSSSGTYTLPTSPSPLYLKVRIAGGGGGGQGGGGGGSAGGTGGTTSFGTSLLVASGGMGGTTGNAGTGGTAIVNSPGVTLIAVSGGSGAGAMAGAASGGSSGGNNPLGGGGGGGSGGAASGYTNGIAGATNTGGGGGGAGGSNTVVPGAGGGAGGYIEAILYTPSSTYSYSVGAAGTAGTMGTITAGAAGGSGVIIVEEFYQ